jgi:flagellar L-ring protein precursor FlgH
MMFALAFAPLAVAADPDPRATPAPAPVHVTLPAAPVRKQETATVSRAPTRPLSVVALESRANEPTMGLNGPLPQAGSLTSVPDPKPRAFKQHDLVTIQISEISAATTNGKVKTDKKYDLLFDVQEFWNFNIDLLGEDANFSGDQLPGVALGTQKKFDTKGDSSRKDAFTARVTAEVIEVRPNGTLVLEAWRHIRNDDELQTIRLSGECRPEDVDATNTVQSQRLANASIEKLTKGQVSESLERGIIAKALDTVFAF